MGGHGQNDFLIELVLMGQLIVRNNNPPNINNTINCHNNSQQTPPQTSPLAAPAGGVLVGSPSVSNSSSHTQIPPQSHNNTATANTATGTASTGNGTVIVTPLATLPCSSSISSKSNK